MKLNIIVVDDSVTDYYALHELICKWADINFHKLEINYFDSPGKFIHESADKLMCDILILDVMLGETDGFEVASKLQLLNPDILFILTSTNKNYAETGYKVSAFDFLPKPIEPMRLSSALDRAAKRVEATKSMYYVFSSEGTTRRILFKDILYFEGSGNYITIHTLSGETYRERSTINLLMTRVPNFCLRVKRNIVANIMNVDSFTNTELFFINNAGSVPMSRDMHETVKKLFMNLNRA